MDLTRRSVFGLAAAVAAGALGGCTPTPGPTPTPTPTPGLDATAPTETNAVPADRLADGGALRLALPALPASWNPWHPDAPAGLADAVAPLRGTWFVRDAAGQVRADPSYVADVRATHEGDTRVALAINPAAVWGDGAPVTAADWMATAAAARWPGVADVRPGASDREVVVTFSGVVPDWTRTLAAGPARAASVAAGVFDDGWGTLKAEWFAGPFAPTHTDARQGLVTLGRNPRWWGTAPRLERIWLRAIPPEAMLAAYVAGELDQLPLALSEADVARARGAADSQLRQAPGPSGRALAFRAGGVLAELPLRQALARALDREAIASAGLTNLTDRRTPWAHHLLLTNHPGYTNQADATGLGFNRQAAAAALAEAGWWLEGSVRTNQGRPLRLSVTVREGDARAAAEADIIADDLEAIGVQITRTVSGGDLEVRTDRFDAWPLANVRRRYGSDAGLKGFVDAMASDPDPARRLQQATQAAHLLMQRCETVPLYQEPQLVATRSALANLGAGGFATTDWTAVGWAR